jgi:hypothetical protein
MTFDRNKIIAEGGKYHGHDNPLIECAPFIVTSSQMLPVAETGFAPAYLKEDANLPKRMVLEGVFQRADAKNANGRVYPRKMWESRLAENGPIKKRIAERAMIGHLEHPTDGTTDLKKGAILVTDVWMESDGTIKGRAIVYNTPDGLILQEYIATGTKVGISSRGTGTVDHKGVVQEDFQLETWDMVYNPSTFGAHPTLQTESVDQTLVVESAASHHTPTSSESPKPMSLSKQIAEARAKAESLLAITPSKLGESARKSLIDQLLDLKVSIAEQFQGEKRVPEVVAILESIEAAKAVAEDTTSGTVGGFRADVIGDKPIGPAPIAGMKTIADALHAIGGEEAKAAAIKAFNEAADMIASNLGSLDKIKTALTAKNEEAERISKEVLEGARNDLLEAAEQLDASEEIIEEMVTRLKAVTAQIEEHAKSKADLEKALAESKALADKLTGTIAEMTAAPKAPEKPITESTQTEKPLTLAERIAALSKQTNESTLPGKSGGVASDTDAGEADKSKVLDEGKKTSPRAALLLKAKAKLINEGFAII